MTQTTTPPIPEFGENLPNKIYIQRPTAYAVLVHEDGRIGIVRNKAGWFLVGGGIEPGESPQEALHRETMEEIAGTIEILGKIGESRERNFSEALQQYFLSDGHFFEARLLAWEDEKGEEDHKLHWVTPEDALQKLVPKSHAWALKELKEKFRI